MTVRDSASLIVDGDQLNDDYFNDIYNSLEDYQKSATSTHGATNITATAVQLVPYSSSRLSLSIQNYNTTAIYVGATAVTVDTGFILYPNEKLDFDRLSSRNSFYAISNSATPINVIWITVN